MSNAVRDRSYLKVVHLMQPVHFFIRLMHCIHDLLRIKMDLFTITFNYIRFYFNTHYYPSLMHKILLFFKPHSLYLVPSTILLQKSVLEKGKIENKRIQTTATIGRYFDNLFIRRSYIICSLYYLVFLDRSAIIPLNLRNVKHYFYKI